MSVIVLGCGLNHPVIAHQPATFLNFLLVKNSQKILKGQKLKKGAEKKKFFSFFASFCFPLLFLSVSVKHQTH
jgi:hypothetical protein